MRYLQITLSLFIFILFTSCGSNTNDKETIVNTDTILPTKVKYTDKEEGFKINFPSEPTKTSENIAIEGMGMVKLTDYSLTKDSYIYMVAVSPQPTENIKTDKDKMSLLISTKEGFCSDLQLNISKEKEIRVGKNPGIFLKANSPKYYAALSILFADSSLYQVTILTKKGEVPDTLVESFINSFELIK